MRFTETLATTIIKLRLKELSNSHYLRNMGKCTLLEDVNTYGQRYCRKNRKYSNNEMILLVGYCDGLYIANELIQNNSYNLESLKEKIHKLPNSYGFVLMGSTYITGFMNGIFATVSENHMFLKKWKKSLMKEIQTVS